MEKPKFTFKPEGVKVPLILSREDEANVIQVTTYVDQTFYYAPHSKKGAFRFALVHLPIHMYENF